MMREMQLPLMEKQEPVDILIVDDREENLMALEVILDNPNYHLIRATSGKEALKILMQDHEIAIILMDVQMPTMDGFETASLIRDSDKYRHVPIIFLSANTDKQEDIFKGYQTGAVDYMVKPLSAEILRAKVSVFAELYRKNQALVKQGIHLQSLNAELQRQSQYVRSLIESSLDPLVTINKKGQITDMNEALTVITGRTRKAIRGSFFYDLFTRPDVARKTYEEVFARGSITDYELTLRNANGGFTDVLFNGSVYRDDVGNVLGAVVVAREKILSKYSRTLIEASLDPLITINSEGKITDMNQAMTAITGLERDQIVGHDFFDYFTDTEKAREFYQKAFADGVVIDSPLTIRHKDGRQADVLLNGSMYKDDHGTVQGIVIVARDITARKKFENELIEARQKAEKAAQIAEEAVRAKQQFLSNMSHEIRTPMNAIVGFTKVVLKTDLNDKQREFINAIKISGDALIVLINDILDLAKVDAGKMTFEQIPFNLNNSLNAMLRLFEPKMQEKKLTLGIEFDESIPETITGDPVRLHQIILNLVSNAVKFTHEGGVTVSAKRVEEDDKRVSIEFTVRDTGIGIEQDKLDSIFDYFQQATSGTSRVYGGTGLGLAIVKQLVRAQGGDIRVESEPDKGSAFIFHLPFKKTRHAAAPIPEEVGAPEEAVTNGRILVAEDVALNQLLIRTLLADAGFETDIASNGKIAVDKLREKNYDLVLMDLQMPEMNGFEATEKIRRELRLQIPIIALTADVTTVDLHKCRQLGMNDYISKPIDEKVLFKKIGRYLSMGQPNNPPNNMKEEQEGSRSGTRCTNLDFVRQLTKNNNDMIAEMIRVYLEETPKLVSKLKTGAMQGDWESVRAAAHSLVPSFSTVGIDDQYTKLCKQVQEFAAKRENTAEIPAMVEKIENVCQKAMQELNTELATLG